MERNPCSKITNRTRAYEIEPGTGFLSQSRYRKAVPYTVRKYILVQAQKNRRVLVYTKRGLQRDHLQIVPNTGRRTKAVYCLIPFCLVYRVTRPFLITVAWVLNAGGETEEGTQWGAGHVRKAFRGEVGFDVKTSTRYSVNGSILSC